MYRIQTTKPRSALKSVPVDVLRSIFGVVVSETSESRAKLHTALCLTHVCAFWRTIATNSPEIWTAVHLHTPKHSSKVFPNVDLLSLVLQNSQKMPLTMEIAVQRALFSQSAVLEATRRFLQEIHRAEILHLRYECLEEFFIRCTFMEIFQPKMTGSPYLTHLSLDFEDSTSPSAYNMTRIWAPAPLLENLSIYNDILDLGSIRSFHSTKFPFHRLTNLTITSHLEVRGLFLILSWATSLVVGKFCLVYGEIPSSSDFFHLPDLYELDLRGQGFGRSAGYDLEASPPLSRVLAPIKAPSLQRLTLMADRDWSQASFGRFLRISACQITYLHLDIVDFDNGERLECLRLLPFIQVLDISAANIRYSRFRDCFNQEFAKGLRERNAETGEFLICPQMSKIILDYDAIYDTTNTYFADFVEDRWKRLACFEVSLGRAGDLGQRQIDLCELIRLLSLKRSGLNITIDPVPLWETLICRR
ncbi:hypothetical protein CVT26_011775 [Gymnopilus dilepis]|uniref:F-box domain-containing protein n=1 Tax=Gymnopilus dilepis TaxID=231916 RepID=A0A409W922_9AGAR|nr:hypothetical protein CVT26_011775 [Gymnopilus dilepis]